MKVRIDTIVVGTRQRSSVVTDDLVRSMENYGQLQPIVLSGNNLVAGERRLRAAQALGWTDIEAVQLGDLTPVKRAEMELEENVRRNDLPWQDRCKAIATIHAMHGGGNWGFAETGEMLGLAQSNVWYATEVANALNANDEEIAKAPHMTAAISILLARKAKQAGSVLKQLMAPRAIVEPASGPMVAEPPLHNIDYVLGDGIEWLLSQPAGSVSCIYTDPPYGIDMDNLDQPALKMNLEHVRAEHDVEQNVELLAKFAKAAAHALSQHGYLVAWCDAWNFRAFADMLLEADLSVQRWPLVWVKTTVCQNGSPYQNFTKRIEVAVVAHKIGAQLRACAPQNWWLGPRDADKPHPFWKPVALHEWVLQYISLRGERVIDPFAGAGSIAVACAHTQRKYTGIEINPVIYSELINTVAMLK